MYFLLIIKGVVCMRYILKYRLDNGMGLYVVLDASSESAAKTIPLKSVHSLPSQYRFESRNYQSSEKWSIKTKTVPQKGNHQYQYFVVDSSGMRSGKIKGLGVKTAIANLEREIKINKVCRIFLYDLEDIKKKRKSSLRKARETLQSKASTVSVYTQALEKEEVVKNSGLLKELTLLTNMTLDYMSGKYKEVPFNVILGITAAVVYIACPVDLIPDFLPVIGQVDDIAVLTWVLKRFHAELMKYSEWREQNTEKK